MTGPLLNLTLITERREALNLSVRALVQATGVPYRPIYAGGAESARYRAYGVGASVTLAQLSRLADMPAELLSTEGAGPVGPPADDVAVLLAAVTDDAKDSVTHIDDIADALGWSLERIEEAAREASEHLPALGLTLHRNHGGGLCVRAGHAVLSPEEQQRLARAKTVRTKLHLHQARVLRDVARGDLAKNWRRKLSADRRLSIQSLLKRGLVEDTPQGLRLTATAAYSLMLTDDTAAGEEASQALDVDWSTTDLQKSRKPGVQVLSEHPPRPPGSGSTRGPGSANRQAIRSATLSASTFTHVTFFGAPRVGVAPGLSGRRLALWWLG